MPTIRIAESIWSLILLVLFQIIILYVVLYANDAKFNRKIVHKSNCNSSEPEISDNNGLF
jgi:hypothetical protein